LEHHDHFQIRDGTALLSTSHFLHSLQSNSKYFRKTIILQRNYFYARGLEKQQHRVLMGKNILLAS